MRDIWQVPPPEQAVMIAKPVLRVFEKGERLDPRIEELFAISGYTIVEEGISKPSNSLELTIDVGFSWRTPFAQQRKEAGSTASGIPLPETYGFNNLIRIQKPVVAKDLSKNRGEGKFLLENEEQRLKFITWLMHAQRFVPGFEDGMYDSDYLEGLRREALSSGFYFNEGANPDWNREWALEEFIETPGDYYSSIRSLVDGYGQVHSGIVVRSSHSKTEVKLISTEPTVPNPALDPMDPRRSTALLTDPTSPFYLGSRNIVSNVSSGGKAIFLDGKAVEGEIDREVLTKLEIDPDNPHLPSELVHASGEIASVLRTIPYVGIDFIKRGDNGSFAILEVNIGPMLPPEIFGAPAGTKQKDLELILYERIIQGAKARHPEAFGKSLQV